MIGFTTVAFVLVLVLASTSALALSPFIKYLKNLPSF